MLSGCITAIITPMFENGEVDYGALTNLVEWQIASGVTGLVLVGSTGEAATLTNLEKIQVVSHVVEINHNRVKLIVGIGAASTATVLEFISQLNQVSGIDYLMCITPYYVKPTQQGLYAHFAMVASASAFPLILYNVPGRTGCDLEDDTLIRLAYDFPKIVGLKDATGDLARCTYLLAHKPDKFMLFSGDDMSGLAFMLSGGDGVISVVSNIRPQQFSDMCKAALMGNREQALVFNRQLLPLYSLSVCEANPIPIKWGLYCEGKISSAHLRLPLTILNPIFHEKLRQELQRIN